MAESSDHLEEPPEVTRAGGPEAQRQLAAGERILTRVVNEKKKLHDSHTKLGEELKDMLAQLADSMKENKRLRGGIFSMCSNLPLRNLAREETDRIMSVGMLTGRPEEEVSGSSSDLLQELSQMHERARQAMRSIAKALWPSDSL